MSSNFITFSARAKLHHLIKSGGAIGIKFQIHKLGGISIDFVKRNSEHGQVTLSSHPQVTSDLFTLMKIQSNAIDFSYDSGEFIITKDPNPALLV